MTNTMQTEADAWLEKLPASLAADGERLVGRLLDTITELQQSRDVYTELFHFAPIGFMTLARDGKIVDANRNAIALLGIKGEALVGDQNFQEFVSPDAYESWEQHRRRVLAGEGKQVCELKLQRADLSPFFGRIECSLIPGDNHTSRCTSMALVDLTERQETEDILRRRRDDLEREISEQALDLRQSEQKYRRLFEAETDAILLFDAETRQIVDVNLAALDTYGYSRDEFLRMKQQDITAEPEKTEASIRETLEEGLTRIPLRYHRKKDGTLFPVEISACTILWEGRVVVCGVIRDITEQVHREQALADQRVELRKLALELSLAGDRERRRIATELHDDLGQVLASCRMRLDLVQEADVPADVNHGLQSVGAILDRAIEATRSMTFKLSSPMLDQLGLGPALDQLCRDMSRDTGVQFEFLGDLECSRLSDERRLFLYRCTRELLFNVVKHASAWNASVKLQEVDPCVRIEVVDDGSGFDASRAGKGFSPSGGFGLFNIREYVQHTGGRLEIESSDAGTRVILEVPMELEVS